MGGAGGPRRCRGPQMGPGLVERTAGFVGLARVFVVSGGDGALVEEELPAVVAEDPEGGAVGDVESGGGVVGGDGDVRSQGVDVEVADGGGAGGAVEEGVDGLLAVHDAARAAELLKVLC